MLKQQCIHKGYPQKTAINFFDGLLGRRPDSRHHAEIQQILSIPPNSEESQNFLWDSLHLAG